MWLVTPLHIFHLIPSSRDNFAIVLAQYKWKYEFHCLQTMDFSFAWYYYYFWMFVFNRIGYLMKSNGFFCRYLLFKTAPIFNNCFHFCLRVTIAICSPGKSIRHRLASSFRAKRASQVCVRQVWSLKSIYSSALMCVRLVWSAFINSFGPNPTSHRNCISILLVLHRNNTDYLR